jgi:phage/plasmid-like protein (TIGR03299 family)
MTATLTSPPESTERPLPWAGLTTGSFKANGQFHTSADLLTKAGLNWSVAKRPYLRSTPEGPTPSTRSYEVYRTDTGEELGNVKGHYQVYQNADAFAFADSLVLTGQARWAEAGLQGNGWRIFVTMELTEKFEVLGSDLHSMYVVLQTSHDGSAAVRGFLTPIRYWCTNQNDVLRDTSLSRFSYQHTTNLHERLQEAQLSFQQAVHYETAFKQLAEDLAKVSVTESGLRNILVKAIPNDRARKLELVEEIVATYRTSPTIEGFRDNGWGAINAVTEHMDHVITRRTGNARFEQIMTGEGAKLRRNVTNALLST